MYSATIQDSMRLLKINDLNVNTPRTWKIRANIVEKFSVIPYSNANTQNGKRFSFDVGDSTGIIRITAFNDEVDKFNSIIEPDGLYTIAGGLIKQANKTFNKLDHACEITLNTTSVIEKHSFHRTGLSAGANSMASSIVTQLESNPAIEEFLKQNEEDKKLVSERLIELDNMNKQQNIERKKLESKRIRLSYERNALISRLNM